MNGKSRTANKIWDLFKQGHSVGEIAMIVHKTIFEVHDIIGKQIKRKVK